VLRCADDAPSIEEEIGPMDPLLMKFVVDQQERERERRREYLRVARERGDLQVRTTRAAAGWTRLRAWSADRLSGAAARLAPRGGEPEPCCAMA
jgi:hypothetical protein